MIDEWQKYREGEKPGIAGLFVCLYVLLFWGFVAGVVIGLVLVQVLR